MPDFDEEYDDELTDEEYERIKATIERIDSGEEKLIRLILPKFGEMFRFGSYAVLKDEYGFDSDRYSRTAITVWRQNHLARKRFGWLPDVHVIKQLSHHWWLVSISKDPDGQVGDHDE